MGALLGDKCVIKDCKKNAMVGSSFCRQCYNVVHFLHQEDSEEYVFRTQGYRGLYRWQGRIKARLELERKAI